MVLGAGQSRPRRRSLVRGPRSAVRGPRSARPVGRSLRARRAGVLPSLMEDERALLEGNLRVDRPEEELGLAVGVEAEPGLTGRLDEERGAVACDRQGE